MEQLAVIHGDIDIQRANGRPSLEGLQGVTAWRADARQGVVTTMAVGDNDDSEGLDPNERSLLDWLKSAELPSPCAIMVQVPPNMEMEDFDADLAALCER